MANNSSMTTITSKTTTKIETRIGPDGKKTKVATELTQSSQSTKVCSFRLALIVSQDQQVFNTLKTTEGEIKTLPPNTEQRVIDPGPVFAGFRAAEYGLEYNTCNGPVLLHPRKRRVKVETEANYDVYKSDFGGKVGGIGGGARATVSDLSRAKGRDEFRPQFDVAPGDYDTSATQMFQVRGGQQSAVMGSTKSRFATLYTSGQGADYFIDPTETELQKKRTQWAKPSPGMLGPIESSRLRVGRIADLKSSHFLIHYFCF